MFTRHYRLFVHPVHGVPRGSIQPIPPKALRRQLVPRASDIVFDPARTSYALGESTSSATSSARGRGRLKPLGRSMIPSRNYLLSPSRDGVQEPFSVPEHERAWKKMFDSLRKN